jgi:hypothetical protein
MACRRLLVDRVLVVAWRQPEMEDLESVTDQLYDASTRQARKLLYLSVIGPKALPQGAVRDALVDFYRNVLSFCDSMHVVIEGNEFEMSIKRSVIANVLLVVQGRGRIFIENSLERVKAVAPIDVRGEIDRAIRQASDQHVFDFARSEPPGAVGS